MPKAADTPTTSSQRARLATAGTAPTLAALVAGPGAKADDGRLSADDAYTEFARMRFERIPEAAAGGEMERDLGQKRAWLNTIGMHHPNIVVMLAALQRNDGEMLALCRELGPDALMEFGDCLQSSRDYFIALSDMRNTALFRNAAAVCRYSSQPGWSA